METNVNKFFLIGHRGVGKSSIVKDLNLKSENYVCYDLDEQVELRRNIKIQELFKANKIFLFRKLEHQVLDELLLEFNKELKAALKKKQKSKMLVISLGAGFEIEKFKRPKNSVLLWIRRKSDQEGRIFFNRPAITKNKNPLDEWKDIYNIRHKKYAKYSTAQLNVPECYGSAVDIFLRYLNPIKIKNGYVTYLPNENGFVLDKGQHNIELRTDILSATQILKILNPNAGLKYILAIRNLNPIIKNIKYLKDIFKGQSADLLIDWDMALGFVPENLSQLIDIYSSHSQNPIEDVLVFQNHIEECFGFKYTKSVHYKLCPEVLDHEAAINLDLELKELLCDLSYSFLPRSKDGFNLTYFRQLKSYQQKIGFYKFGEGSSNDQPYWYEWPIIKPKGYYGIYGQNIQHSLTPSFHFNFFKNKNLWPLSIASFENFFNYKQYFTDSDLKALAVTSPYKELAFRSSHFKRFDDLDCKKTLSADTNNNQNTDLEKFKSSNTLIFKDRVESYNTDYPALKIYLNTHLDPDKKIIVWGGGALLNQLKSLCPKADFYSARTGKLRSVNVEVNLKSDNLKKNIQLIWASGDKGKNPDFIFNKFNIQKIIDLDYRENSKARLYSFLNAIEYVGGYDFFREQALMQQKIWDTYEF